MNTMFYEFMNFYIQHNCLLQQLLEIRVFELAVCLRNTSPHFKTRLHDWQQYPFSTLLIYHLFIINVHTTVESLYLAPEGIDMTFEI